MGQVLKAEPWVTCWVLTTILWGGSILIPISEVNKLRQDRGEVTACSWQSEGLPRHPREFGAGVGGKSGAGEGSELETLSS